MALAEAFGARPTRGAHIAPVRSFGQRPEYSGEAFAELVRWVDEVAALLKPDSVFWVDGSAEENQYLLDLQVAEGRLIKLNEDLRPGSYLARSHPSDVARTEGRTFIASEREEDAGGGSDQQRGTLRHPPAGFAPGKDQ